MHFASLVQQIPFLLFVVSHAVPSSHLTCIRWQRYLALTNNTATLIDNASILGAGVNPVNRKSL